MQLLCAHSSLSVSNTLTMIFHILPSIDTLCQFVSRPKLKFELTFCIFIFIGIFQNNLQIASFDRWLTQFRPLFLCFAFACENFWLLYLKQLGRIVWKFLPLVGCWNTDLLHYPSYKDLQFFLFYSSCSF